MFEQGSPEWHEERRGKATASRVADIMATTKSGPAASRKNYLAELVAERLTGTVAQGFTNAAMQWGTETEDQARAAYEMETRQAVELVGFVPHPSISMAGASPDGLLGEDGLIEIKCPNTATHIAALLGGKVERKYLLQVQFQLACTGRAWCDFVSFDPRLPDEMRMFVERVRRDDDMIGQIEIAILEFLGEVEATERALRRKYKPHMDEIAKESAP